jgi:hypothetical protein
MNGRSRGFVPVVFPEERKNENLCTRIFKSSTFKRRKAVPIGAMENRV